jgi:hypothetical protein
MDDGTRISAPVRHAGLVEPTPLSVLPSEWFLASEELEPLGWPDFKVRALADWKSSVSPVPDEPVEDCCVVLCFPRVVRPLGDDGWVFALHETGGIWQERRRVVAMRLPTAPGGSAVAHAIARAMAHSNISAAFALFDQVAEYRRLLNEHGLDCNQHFQSLAEGFYPIDLTDEALGILQVASVPAEVLDVMEADTMCLAVLAPNCCEW